MASDGRKILRISGPDRVHFLQGLVTNDVEKVKNGLVYAALLTPQGKYLADFFLVPDGEDILIDVAEDLAAGLMQRLNMYKLRAQVTLAETDLSMTRGLGDAPEGGFADPRHPALGWRAYGGQPGETGVDWDGLRVSHAVPESGVELGPETFILEAGFERLNGVDFRKGCYVGQEVTARMKHKTSLRKGLTQVTVEGAAAPGSEIMRNGKPVGVLYTQSGGRALAYLRFERAGDGMTAGEARVSHAGGAVG